MTDSLTEARIGALEATVTSLGAAFEQQQRDNDLTAGAQRLAYADRERLRQALSAADADRERLREDVLRLHRSQGVRIQSLEDRGDDRVLAPPPTRVPAVEIIASEIAMTTDDYCGMSCDDIAENVIRRLTAAGWFILHAPESDHMTVNYAEVAESLTARLTEDHPG